MTEYEHICLAYLDRLMEANAAMIGKRIWDFSRKRNGSNLSAIGAAVVGRLRRRGLVTYLPELKAWRITSAGRVALEQAREK